jgi:hypothetical protein
LRLPYLSFPLGTPAEASAEDCDGKGPVDRPEFCEGPSLRLGGERDLLLLRSCRLPSPASRLLLLASRR